MQYCAQPGCSVLVPRGRCPAHQPPRQNVAVRRWYRITSWAWLRRQVIVEQASACAQCGRVTVRLEVDHIRKHEGDPARFWDRENLQALCPHCHVLKTRAGA